MNTLYDFKTFDDFLDKLDLFEFIKNCDFTSDSSLINEIKLIDPPINNIGTINKSITKFKRKYHTICNNDNCDKPARYGLLKGIPITCRIHKLILYYDVTSKLCKFPECKIQPSFGYRYCKMEYCKKHSTSDMINLKIKMCYYKNCKQKASYGYPLQKAEYCPFHQSFGMIQILKRSYNKKI